MNGSVDQNSKPLPDILVFHKEDDGFWLVTAEDSEETLFSSGPDSPSLQLAEELVQRWNQWRE